MTLAARNLLISILCLAIAAWIALRAPDASQGVQAAVGWLVSVGTLWLRSGRAPALQELPEVPPVPRPPTVIVGPLLALVLLCSSCAGGLGVALREAIQCGPVAAGLAAEVAAALRSDDFTSRLDRLIASVGNAAVCAISAVGQASPVAGTGLAPASAGLGVEEAQRARGYLAQRGLAVRP